MIDPLCINQSDLKHELNNWIECLGCRHLVGAQREAGQHHQEGVHAPPPRGKIRKHQGGQAASSKGNQELNKTSDVVEHFLNELYLFLY